jgi:uncharacterized membrane protein YhfC
MNLTLAVFVIAGLVIGLGPAFLIRYRFKSAWRFFWLGAVTIVVFSSIGGFVGSFVGGFIGGLSSALADMPLNNPFAPASPTFAALVAVSAAIFEEGGRLFLVRWLFKRTSSRLTLSDSLMCGAGFVAVENILRVGWVAWELLLTTSTGSTGRSFELSSIGAGPYSPIGYAAIGIFHITLTMFVAHMLGANRFPPFSVFAVLAIYHGAANAAALIFTNILLQPDLASAMWLLIATANSILAIQIFRNSSSAPN